MADVDQRSPNLHLPLPVFDSNTMNFDVPRLAEALLMIDTVCTDLQQAVSGKASSDHQHQIAQIIGLADALEGKAAADFRPQLDELTDVDVTAAAQRMVLMRIGQYWQASRFLLSDIEGWEGTVDAKIAGAIAAMAGQAPATLDTFAELASALGNDPNFATTIATALGNRLRFDGVQARMEAEQNQAIANLGGTALGRQLLKVVDQATARSLIGAVGLANPGAFTGDMTVPQPVAADNSLRPATTNWVRVLINAVNASIADVNAAKFDKSGGTVSGQITSANGVPTAFEATGAGPRYSWHIPGEVRKFLQAATTQLSLIDQGGTPHHSWLFDGRIWTSAYGYLDAKFYSTAADIAAVTGAAGGVGAYAFCTRTGGAVSHGQTVGGSTLVPAIGGTWRVMGQSVSNTVAGLFVRIS